jgi:hypothetical protein
MTGWTGRPAGQQGPAWCAYAVTTWWSLKLPHFGSVDSILGWARRRRLLHDPVFEGAFVPHPGDIFGVVARRPASGTVPFDGGVHTGLVLAVDPQADVVVTVEGNSANRVRSIRRPWGSLVFVRISDAVWV